MKACERKFGNDGYAMWYKLLEQMGNANNHYIDVNDEDYFLEVAEYCNVDVELFTEFMDWITSKNWNVFSKTLWEQKIIMSPSFSENLTEDMYKRRKDGSKPITEEELISKVNQSEEELEDKLSEEEVKWEEKIKETQLNLT